MSDEIKQSLSSENKMEREKPKKNNKLRKR
jgi:hypothetical protein